MNSRHTRTRMPIRLPVVALLVGLCSLLSSAFALARTPPDALEDRVEPAQVVTRVYLPTVARPGAPTASGVPVIGAFALSSTSGSLGAEVSLRWRVQGATQLRVEPKPGVVSGSGITVYPVATTTYTLTATNARGSTTATATYTVNAPPVVNPLTVSARPDAGRAAAAPVGAGGGSVTAVGVDGTRYVLTVPPEALLHTELITLTPMTAIDDMPFAASGVRAAGIGPEDLEFLAPATLVITPPAPPSGKVIGFAFQGMGAEFALRRTLEAGAAELTQTPGSRSISVLGAGGQGVAEVADDDLLAPLVKNPPSRPVDAAEHITVSVDESPRPGAAAILFSWVLPLLKTAVTDPAQVDAAARNYITWRALISGREDTFRDEISEANLLLGEALRKAGELATERCNQGRPAQGFALQRYMAYAKRFGLVNTRAALEERLEKCWVFELRFDSTISGTTSSGGTHLDQVLSTVTLRADTATGRIVGSGVSAWGKNLHSEPESGNQACVQSMTTAPSTFDAASGELGLTLRPVSRTSPNINLSLAYDPGHPSGQVLWTCKGAVVTFDIGLAWRGPYEAFHHDELLGEAAFVATKNEPASGSVVWSYQRSAAAGDGVVTEGTTITLEHTPGR